MGQAKRDWERVMDLEGPAREALLQAGALKRCPMHEDILINQDDADKQKIAYAIGTNMVKEGKVEGTREDLMDAIKGEIEGSADECGICAKNFRD